MVYIVYENNGIFNIWAIFLWLCFLLNGFIIMDLDYSNNNESIAFVFAYDNLDSYRWHAMLDHIGQERLTIVS